MFKKTILYITIVLLIIFGFIIGSGLYFMEIEDHYGDLQEIYFESRNGDLIVNKQNRTFGVISKDWKRAHIITKQKDTLDLYDFVSENKYEVFRSEADFDLTNLSFEKLMELKNKKRIESILSN